MNKVNLVHIRTLFLLTATFLLRSGIQGQNPLDSSKSWLLTGQFGKVIEQVPRVLEKETHLPRVAGEGENNLGIAFYSLGQYSEAIRCYKNAIRIYSNHNLDTLAAQSLLNLGITYKRIADYEKSLSILFPAVQAFESLKMRKEHASAMNTIGNIHREMEQYDSAIRSHQNALEIRKLMNNKKGIAGSLNNLGMVMLEVNRLNQSKAYLLEAKKVKIELGDSLGMGSTLGNLGEVALKLKDFELAKKYFERSLSLRRKFGDRKGEAVTLNLMAEVDIEVGGLTSAKTHLLEAYRLANELGTLDTEVRSLELLKDVFVQLDKPNLALSYYDKYLAAKDKFLNLEKAKTLELLKTRFETEQKDKENLQLSKNNQQQRELIQAQRAFLTVLAIAFLLVMFLAVTAWRAFQARREQANREIELKKEMHHRIANDLMAIAGAMALNSVELGKSWAAKDKARQTISQARGSIHAVLGIHKTLYHSGSKADEGILLGSIFYQIWESNLKIFNISPSEIKSHFEIPGVEVKPEEATTIGIIFNEMICNALKHGLDTGPDAMLNISCTIQRISPKMLSLGFSNTSLSSEFHAEEGGEGLEILKGLIKQLGGDLSIENADGFFVISAKFKA